MPPNRSHPSSPWSVTRKPRAVAPRTIQDYNLLAATVACWGMPTSKISQQFGFEEDYVGRLLRNGSGRAFTEWLWQRPEEFVKQFEVSFDSQPELEECPFPDPDPPIHHARLEEALKFFRGTDKDE